MKPSDINRIVTVGSPVISPDGTQVAYVVRRVDVDANAYRSAIWLAPVDGSAEPRQLTAGSESDSSPRWSPRSERIAFTSSRGKDDDRKVSLHVIPVDRSGETVTLATSQEGIGDLAWSPDGRRLAYASRVRDERYSDGKDERAQPPRRIDRLFAKNNGEGWTVDRPTQLWVVPVDGSAAPRQLTRDPFEHGAPTWSPDGRRIATVAGRHEDHDLDFRSDIWVLDVDEIDRSDDDSVPELRQLTETEAEYAELSWSPDGSRIAALRAPSGVGYRHSRVAVVDAESGRVEVLTADLDLNAAPYPNMRPSVWVGDSALLFGVEERGSVGLRRVDIDGGAVDELLGGRRMISGWDATPDGETVAFVASASPAPMELFVRTGAGERQLTHHQDAFVAAAPPLAWERFEVASPDGMALDAWAVLPPGFDPEKRYPALLNIHGGPHAMYGEGWFDEFQLFASAGFVVLFANPRGSTGYSEASARVLLSPVSSEDPGEGWGEPAFADLMAVVDAALERYPAIDPDRLGVLGGSYGGYMTSWTVGHTTRFAAACSERACNNLASLDWSSDGAGYFRMEIGANWLDAPEEYARQSPITYVKSIETPLLILHSEDDWRCPVEQADALFVALRLLGKKPGVDMDYYRFPAEDHDLSRSGSPRHRVQRAELIIGWFRDRLGASGRESELRSENRPAPLAPAP